jgi:threonine dehydratase
MQPPSPIPLADIRAAAERIRGIALRTPLLRLPIDGPTAFFLKLENLQPIGSFKLRGAANALALATDDELRDGVYTASAGNMAQGVAWVARQRSVPCRVVVPDHAPAIKLAAIERLGGEVVKVPFAQWWEVLLQRGRAGMRGRFVHPVSDPAVIAGNGTIGLEIAADLPEVDAVVVPYGGGGLLAGIASALRAVRPSARVFAAEVATAAPLAAALAAGEPVAIDHVASFVDGIGGRGLLPEMWPIVRELLAGSIVVGLEEVAAAIRLLVERSRVVAEGAGAASVAAALTGRAGGGNVVCVVSGGNIDSAVLSRILAGGQP